STQPLTTKKATPKTHKDNYPPKPPKNPNNLNAIPHAPTRPIQAKVISTFDGVNEASQLQTITLDKGELDSSNKGTVVGLYKRSRHQYQC
ncbi:LysM peptidoglycan-binding domain-containing protein, partial [Neisseria sp. P0021.S006]